MTFSEWEKLEKGKLNFRSRQDESVCTLRVLPDVSGQNGFYTHARVYVLFFDPLISPAVSEKISTLFKRNPIIISTINDEPK